MKATLHFSIDIEADSFEDLQKRINGLTAILKEQNIVYSINSEGAA